MASLSNNLVLLLLSSLLFFLTHLNTKAMADSNNKLANSPSAIKYGPLSFLVMDAPSDANLHLYIKELEKNNVKDVVRVCEATYSKEKLEELGIKVHVSLLSAYNNDLLNVISILLQDWSFSDGEAPPVHIVEDWLKLVEARFGSLSKKKMLKNPAEGSSATENANGLCIAIHCVAGLGR